MATAKDILFAAGLPRLEARMLLEHVLRKPRSWILAHDTDPLPPEAVRAYTVLAARRAAGEPIAYLLGEREFMGHAFKVGPDVLIPRPETELLVETGLEWLQGFDSLSVLDMGTGSGAIAISIALARPDVAVLDVRLPDGNGIDLCRDLLAAHDELRCLILTSFTDEQSMLDAIMAGASGYVVKDIRGMELAQAIKEVGSGRSLLDNRAAAALMSKLRQDTHTETTDDPRLRDLSATERTLLELLGEGLTNREIGERMFLAEKTVKNYVSRLLAKLGLHRRTQAALLAAELRQKHHD